MHDQNRMFLRISRRDIDVVFMFLVPLPSSCSPCLFFLAPTFAVFSILSLIFFFLSSSFFFFFCLSSSSSSSFFFFFFLFRKNGAGRAAEAPSPRFRTNRDSMSTSGPSYPHRHSETPSLTPSEDGQPPPPKAAFPTEGSMEAYLDHARELFNYANIFEQQNRLQEARELYADALRKLQTVCDRGTVEGEIEQARALVGRPADEPRRSKEKKNKEEEKKKKNERERRRKKIDTNEVFFLGTKRD